ncbi:cysteine--1-D-myo-inosityl 2-amino-2-deoxy-alpha-D-glucopyranoside ligase, partial [Streptomyces sp. NPDC050804]|uniref:cysteine--1-D-myo-inosityl 2-amino-2-deoxy-alpha-D-glucopyranoside ligase n=1 Tax=Streptomyces sp. NPDC050804 TaxID=3154745 RepID=UPI00341FCB09
MYAWPASEVPALPGSGRDLRIHDTSTDGRVTLEPGPVARIYVCGITPYDATHMGHAATYNAFDLVQRVWLDTKRQVQYVQNVTDVDDPLLERARRDGEDWVGLAERETALFREDMTALRMLPPQHYIGAVEAIPGIVPLVERLRDAGAAYELEGDVYFSVAADPRFGEVSRLDARAMRLLSAERGGDPDRPGKKNPLDPILWLAARPGEPSWDGGTLGRGRPGWHIECVAIALDHLGMGFDVQGGGSDLAFPHHEMGASHAQVLTGEHPFARAYVHAGMVGLNGEKMSKSKGNLVFVSTLRHEGVDPAAIRLALLAHHYRSDWEWTDAVLQEAVERLGRWRAAVSRPDGPPSDAVVDEIQERRGGVQIVRQGLT